MVGSLDGYTLAIDIRKVRTNSEHCGLFDYSSANLKPQTPFNSISLLVTSPLETAITMLVSNRVSHIIPLQIFSTEEGISEFINHDIGSPAKEFI